MHVSFDIDDTLICCQPGAVHEPNQVPRLLRPWFPEPLRLGAIALMQELTRQGHTLSVYTTSYRSPNYLRLWFRFYGIRVVSVVNQRKHEEVVKAESFRRRPSKYPPAFGIDIHVDDGVGQPHLTTRRSLGNGGPQWSKLLRYGVKTPTDRLRGQKSNTEPVMPRRVLFLSPYSPSRPPGSQSGAAAPC